MTGLLTRLGVYLITVGLMLLGLIALIGGCRGLERWAP